MNNNGSLPAYPVSCVDTDGHMTGTQAQISGLTKREKFSISIMQALLSNETVKLHIGVGRQENKDLSVICISIADALLEELERTK